jgi:hypothetical protein
VRALRTAGVAHAPRRPGHRLEPTGRSSGLLSPPPARDPRRPYSMMWSSTRFSASLNGSSQICRSGGSGATRGVGPGCVVSHLFATPPAGTRSTTTRFRRGHHDATARPELRAMQVAAQPPATDRGVRARRTAVSAVASSARRTQPSGGTRRRRTTPPVTSSGTTSTTLPQVVPAPRNTRRSRGRRPVFRAREPPPAPDRTFRHGPSMRPRTRPRANTDRREPPGAGLDDDGRAAVSTMLPGNGQIPLVGNPFGDDHGADTEEVTGSIRVSPTTFIQVRGRFGIDRSCLLTFAYPDAYPDGADAGRRWTCPKGVRPGAGVRRGSG